MKKILAILIGAIMSITICCVTGCNGSGKSKVELIGIQTSVFKEKVSTQNKGIALYERDVQIEESNDGDDIILPGKEEDTLLNGTDYTVIYKHQNVIKFTINLNNPNDYTIFDFKLTAENESVDYYDKSEDEWIPLSDESIRWQGINNKKCSYLLRLNNDETTPSKLKISSMYYSDKSDGSNRNAVNLNNKETYTVYKIDNSLENNIIRMTDIVNSESELNFKIDKIAGAEINEVLFDEVVINADENGVYKITKDGKLQIKYGYTVTDGIDYKATYEEDVELIRFYFPETQEIWYNEDGSMDIIYIGISGTDVKNLCDPETGIEPLQEYNGTEYYISADSMRILNVDRNIPFEEFIESTEIMVAGKVYKLSFFIVDGYRICN